MKRFEMNNKIQSFFSKFKWWRGEIDAIKIVPAILIFLAFLPVLPHEKKNGKLNSVLGVEASVDNFYFIFDDFTETLEIKREHPLYELAKLVEMPIANTTKHKEYLINQGSSEELAKCIVLRDLFLNNYFYDIEMKTLLNQYAPSPVPVIWITRILFKYYLDLVSTPSIRYEGFNKLVENCSKFKNMGPPSGYLDGDFSYEK